jgi:hypothetical protein
LGLNHTEARLPTLLRQKGGMAARDPLSNKLSVEQKQRRPGSRALCWSKISFGDLKKAAAGAIVERAWTGSGRVDEMR